MTEKMIFDPEMLKTANDLQEAIRDPAYWRDRDPQVVKAVNEGFKNLYGGDKPDMINHPPHYTNHPSGIECIEITRHENFNCGNAIKYIWRRNDKGTPIEDLKKAVFYLKDEIKRLEAIRDNEVASG